MGSHSAAFPPRRPVDEQEPRSRRRGRAFGFLACCCGPARKGRSRSRSSRARCRVRARRDGRPIALSGPFSGGDWGGSRGERTQPVAAAMVLASFFMVKGTIAGVLAAGWLVVTVLIALGGGRRAAQVRAAGHRELVRCICVLAGRRGVAAPVGARHRPTKPHGTDCPSCGAALSFQRLHPPERCRPSASGATRGPVARAKNTPRPRTSAPAPRTAENTGLKPSYETIEIWAKISETMREPMEKHVRQTGLKKGLLVEQALLHHPELMPGD